MGASQIPAASSGGTTSDNYALISSVTPTNGSSTLSFTGISGYRKLLLKTFEPGLSSGSTITITFNSDTGANYAYQAAGMTSSTGAVAATFRAGAATGIPFASVISAGLQTNLIINDTNTTGVKTIEGFVYGGTFGGQTYPVFNGMYFASAAITTVTLTVTTNTFTAAGTVALYGVAA
jgi:hypothetical protein